MNEEKVTVSDLLFAWYNKFTVFVPESLRKLGVAEKEIERVVYMIPLDPRVITAFVPHLLESRQKDSNFLSMLLNEFNVQYDRTQPIPKEITEKAGAYLETLQSIIKQLE